MESKNNQFPATDESEKNILNILSLPTIYEEGNGTNSFDPTLFQISSVNDPLNAPSTSTLRQLEDNFRSISVTSELDEGDQYSSYEVGPFLESRENIHVTTSSLISPDLLSQTEKVLKTLSLDIELSLKNIVKSIAMPSVIEIYNKRWGNKTSSVAKLSSSTEPSSSQTGEPQSQPTPQLSTNFNIEALDSNHNHMDILQQRCLQYREMILDIAIHALVVCGTFTEESVNRMTCLIKQFHGLRANFWSFKNLSFSGSFSKSSTQMLTDMVTDVIQSTFLRVLLEENETYMARLDMGLQLGKVCAMVLKVENETRALIALMEGEARDIKYISTGFRI